MTAVTQEPQGSSRAGIGEQYGRRRSTRGADPHDASPAGCKQDDTLTVPVAAERVRTGSAEGLRWAAGNFNLLDLPKCGKHEKTAVGRPDQSAPRVVRAWQRPRLDRVHRPNPDVVRRRVGRLEGDVAAVRGNAEGAADIEVGLLRRRNFESHGR